MIISIKISGAERKRGGSFNYERNRDTQRQERKIKNVGFGVWRGGETGQ